MDVVTVDLKKLSPEIHNAFEHVREVAYGDGEVPGKHKLRRGHRGTSRYRRSIADGGSAFIASISKKQRRTFR
jgi:hypothetical protein